MIKYQKALDWLGKQPILNEFGEEIADIKHDGSTKEEFNMLNELVEKSEKYGWRSPDEVPTEKRNDWSSVNILIQTTENKDGFRPNSIILGWYDYNEKQFLHEDMGFDDEFIDVKAWREIEPFEGGEDE